MIEQIKSDQASNRPFFSYVAFNAPHEPISAPERTINYIKRMYEERYPGRELNRGFLEYQSAIYVMDQAGFQIDYARWRYWDHSISLKPLFSRLNGFLKY